MANVRKFQDLLDYITFQNPEGWKQTVWAEGIDEEVLRSLSKRQIADITANPNVCGTAFCLAGTACALELGRNQILWVKNSIGEQDAAELLNGRPIEDEAMELLDITDDEANRLFHGDNTLAMLWEIAQEICGDQLRVPTDEQIAHAEERAHEAERVRREILRFLDRQAADPFRSVGVE